MNVSPVATPLSDHHYQERQLDYNYSLGVDGNNRRNHSLHH